MHGWTFDIRNGEEIRQRGQIPTYMVLLENETIYVQYNPDAEPLWMK
jgi:nitrite reductase/ring-hydroxylating ferredoxin subunit